MAASVPWAGPTASGADPPLGEEAPMEVEQGEQKDSLARLRRAKPAARWRQQGGKASLTLGGFTLRFLGQAPRQPLAPFGALAWAVLSALALCETG